MAKQRTPEEILKAQQEGNAFIQQREQLAAQIDPTGKDRSAQQKAAQQISQQNQSQTQNESSLQQQATGAAMEAKKQEILQQEGGAVQPQQPDLQPQEVKNIGGLGAENKMLFGGNALAALYTASVGAGGKAKIQERVKAIDEEAKTLPADQQQSFINIQRKKIITEENARNGLTFTGRLGVAVEAINPLNKFFRRWGIAFLTPGQKADELTKKITDSGSEIDFALELSFDNPTLALSNLQEIENTNNKLETRIQEAMVVSADLRSDPDGVDSIEREILKNKQKLFLARQTIATRQVNSQLQQNI